jgi:hypothetical protein
MRHAASVSLALSVGFLSEVTSARQGGDMSRFVDSLAINQWFVVIAAVCTMVSVPLTFYFYLKSKRAKLPRYAIRSNNLIKGTKNVIPAVTIRFAGHGEAIDNLTVSKVIFWNAGRDTIKKRDIITPPGIIVQAKNGCTILDAEIVHRTTPENEFEVTKAQDKSQLRVTFKYMDRNEGVLIQVFHTGVKDDDIEVLGKIMGAGSPVKLYIPNPHLAPQKTPEKYSRTWDNVILMFAICFPFLLCFLIWLLSALPREQREMKQPEPIEVPRVAVVIFIIVISAFSWFAAYLGWQKRIPKELVLFYDVGVGTTNETDVSVPKDQPKADKPVD